MNLSEKRHWKEWESAAGHFALGFLASRAEQSTWQQTTKKSCFGNLSWATDDLSQDREEPINQRQIQRSVRGRGNAGGRQGGRGGRDWRVSVSQSVDFFASYRFPDHSLVSMSVQGCDFVHYTLFYINVSKMYIIYIFFDFCTLYIIFVKHVHYFINYTLFLKFLCKTRCAGS